jgi:hypothetical protein
MISLKSRETSKPENNTLSYLKMILKNGSIIEIMNSFIGIHFIFGFRNNPEIDSRRHSSMTALKEGG